MKKKMELLVVITSLMVICACGNSVEETVSKAEYESVVFELQATKAELEKMEDEFELFKETIENAKNETSSEMSAQEKHETMEEGVTSAIDAITVPDPSTQSEFVVELTAENFMSVFEFIAVNEYDVWGEYSSKCFGFSSLLYEQGWALGKVEDFAVEYSVFGESKVTDTNPTAGKPLGYGYHGENEDPDLHIYRAKGTVTFYPIEDVNDTVRVYDSIRYIVRVMPDGSEEWLYTDLEGIMVY